MGSSSLEEGREDDEGPRRSVTVDAPFALSQFEITVAEFAFFVALSGYEVEPGCWHIDPVDQKWKEQATWSWRDPGFDQEENHPVTCVNWRDANAYAEWLTEQTGSSYRLATEAEWEYVARAGTTTSRFWGESDEDACTYANAVDEMAKPIYKAWKHVPCVDAFVYTSPVGIYRPNAWGLHDLPGNLWEWVADCWQPDYSQAPTDQRARLDGDCSRRVIRGAAWDDEPDDLRSANRLSVPAERRYNTIGIRVVKDLSE